MTPGHRRRRVRSPLSLTLNSRALAALSPGAFLDAFRSEFIAVGTEAVGTDSASLVLYNSNPPSPSVAQELPSGMWPAIPCNDLTSLAYVAWKWSRSKAIIPFLQGTAHESHTIPTNMVSIPQLLSTSIPDNWFQPVKHPGRPEDAKMGTRGDPKPDPRCRKDHLADWHYRRRVGSGFYFRVTGTTHAADRVVSHFLELVVGVVVWLLPHDIASPTPHTHTIPRSFLHVHQQGVRQVDEAHSHHYDHAVGLPTSAYRFPLPAYNNATHRHAVRTNGVASSRRLGFGMHCLSNPILPHLPRPLGPIVAYTPYSGMTDAEERVIWDVLDLLSGAPSPDGYTLARCVIIIGGVVPCFLWYRVGGTNGGHGGVIAGMFWGYHGVLMEGRDYVSWRSIQHPRMGGMGPVSLIACLRKTGRLAVWRFCGGEEMRRMRRAESGGGV
ncbi:hypothetical protein Q7P36_001352 [Cladosporium allicinum]